MMEEVSRLVSSPKNKLRKLGWYSSACGGWPSFEIGFTKYNEVGPNEECNHLHFE